MKINEVFYSIQGESTYTGFPTFFIRTTGCNLRCTYCDTKYSYHEGSDRSIDELIAESRASGARHVCLTGGEPLLQKDSLVLMSRLCDEGFFVSLETSGSKSISEVDRRVKVILDVKTPDSGAADSFLERNLLSLNSSTEFKFVICSPRDFEWSENFCSQHGLFENFVVLYSPSFGAVEEAWLAEQILTKKSRARLQLQLHKYIWSPTQRGV
jgi:7-carboxy-7-deazaguanine synthase